MKLTIRQSYIAMFNILDRFYEATKDDILGSLLGGFNPYLFVNSFSADAAAWDDWKNVVSRMTDNELLSPREAICATIDFVKFHQEEFGFDLNWLIEEISDASVEDDDCIKMIGLVN